MNWQNQAACLTENPDIFFPIGTSEAAMSKLEKAKQVCAGCAVRNPCLEWAITTGIDHGVWGGLSEEERRIHKRRTARMRIRTR